MISLGKKLGNIRIREILGEGGMGTVYAGFDERLKRQVAVKTLRDDRLDATTHARLLREARLLSQLDHPNICRIHDFVEGDDSDYLVLELIHGKDLRQALDGGLSPALRLPIAMQVAETLVAAHAKGIAHRDLKPANVMLTSGDPADPGLVKVLDFGIARSLGGGRAEEPPSDQALPADQARPAGAVAGLSAYVRTEHGSVLGTAAYMSPEQARGEPATAASDMYSFGLLLQELCTGRPPYEPDLPHYELLHKAAVGDTLPVSGVEGDLAALIERLKSLAPEVRPSAAETAERLRWIRAKPKRRRRRLLSAAAVAVLALGVLKYTFDLRRERNLAVEAREAAEQAREAAEQARATEEQAREEAEQAHEEAEQVAAFLVDLFEAPDPAHARGEELTARQILERGAEKVERELGDQPLLQARLITTIGGTFGNLDLIQESRELHERALELRRAHLPANHPGLIDSLVMVAGFELYFNVLDRAEQLFLEALAIGEQAGNPVTVAEILGRLGYFYGERSDFERAEAYTRRALEFFETALDDEDPRISEALQSLAYHYRLIGAPRRADPLYRRLIARREKLEDPTTTAFAWSLREHALSYMMQDRLLRAEPLLRRALEINMEVHGPAHTSTGSQLMALAQIETDQGRFAAAERHLERALEIHQRAVGPESIHVGSTLVEYGRFYRDTGDSERASAMLERGCRTLEKIRGRGNFILVPRYELLAAHHADQGRHREAETLYRRMEEIHRKTGNPSPFYLSKALLGLGRVYLATGDLDRGDTVLARALALREEAMGADDPQLGSTLNVLAQAKLAKGEADAADDLYRRALDATRRWLEEDGQENLARAVLAASHLGLGEVADHRGDAAGARAGWLEAVAILEPLTAAVPKVDYLDPHACALLHLGRAREARAVAQPLLDAGWRRPRFSGLAREHGLLPGD